MRMIDRRLAVLARVTAGAALALAFATPAAAQFGGLKKKLRAAAGAEAPADQKTADAATAPAAGNGAVVLTTEVVNQLVTGLKAGEALRQAALTEDTPYARYQRDRTRYETARESCQAAQQTFPNRMAADDRLMARYQGYMDRMAAAQTNGDTRLAMAWTDSAMAMQHPDCIVKEPSQPSDYYEVQRDIDSRAEQTAVKQSGLSWSEFAMARERAEGILRGGPPADVSASETSAVSSRGAELKPLLGIREAMVERAARPAPAAAPTQAAAPTMPPGASAMSQCMAQNSQKHRQEIEALGHRAEAAQQANDRARMMAMADTLQQLQMAGCGGAR
jgi:hypothetical protein